MLCYNKYVIKKERRKRKMEVNYKSKEVRSLLARVSYGQVFRPANSLEVFIRTCGSADDDLFNECDSRIAEYYENPQDLDWDTPSELILCVKVSDGELVLFHREMEVVELDAVLEVEE
jgi:hypothetical protein